MLWSDSLAAWRHYSVVTSSAFWLLDSAGNRLGDGPGPYDQALVEQMLVSPPRGVEISAGTADTEPIAGSEGTELPGNEQPAGESDEQPGVVHVSEDVLDVDMINVHSGETVNLRSVVNGETPLLFWLWSPY